MYARILLLTLAIASATFAQQTRAEEIEADRDRKTASLAPDLPTKWEARLIRFKDERQLERLQAGVAGFRGVLGGLPNGSGLALGTQYARTYKGWSLDGSAAVSSERWTRLEFGIAPKVSGPWLLDLRVARRDYRTLPSPDPDRDYEVVDSTIDALAGVQLRRNLSVGGSAGYQRARFDSERTNFARAGAFLKFDSRGKAAGPRRGSLLVARFDDYRGLNLSNHDFRRIDLEAQHYIPFLNERRVIALRARTVQTFAADGHSVPLIHQSVLGGADDLRGFRPYRFQGANLVVLNAEYRWEAFSGLDMALFGDIGQVSAQRWDVNRLEKSGGVGFRFNARNITFVRIDTAFSRDGARFYIRFNNIFRDRRLNSSSAAHL